MTLIHTGASFELSHSFILFLFLTNTSCSSHSLDLIPFVTYLYLWLMWSPCTFLHLFIFYFILSTPRQQPNQTNRLSQSIHPPTHRRERRSRPRHRHNISQSHSSLILESFLLLLGPSPSPPLLLHHLLLSYDYDYYSYRHTIKDLDAPLLSTSTTALDHHYQLPFHFVSILPFIRWSAIIQ